MKKQNILVIDNIDSFVYNGLFKKKAGEKMCCLRQHAPEVT